jgi:hypothetical protein
MSWDLGIESNFLMSPQSGFEQIVYGVHYPDFILIPSISLHRST